MNSEIRYVRTIILDIYNVLWIFKCFKFKILLTVCKFSKNSASLIFWHLNYYSEIISLKILVCVTALVMSTEPSSLSFNESESDSDCIFLSESIEECDAANSEMDSDIEIMEEELPPETETTVPSSKRKCKIILDYYGKEKPSSHHAYPKFLLTL